MARSKKCLNRSVVNEVQPTEELAGVPSLQNNEGEWAGVIPSVTQGTNQECIDERLGGRPMKRLKRSVVNEVQPTEELAGVPSLQNNEGECGEVTPSVTQGTNLEGIDERLGVGSRRRSRKLGSSSRRKSRGRTRMMYIWKNTSNEKIVIWANRFAQPIGPEASKFTNFCGVVVRNPHLCPLSYPNWSRVSKENKMAAFATIKEHFIYSDVLKKWVNKSVAKKWRDYKSYLKGRFYFPDKSEAENARAVPPRVMAEDWQYLVNYWKSEKGKKREELNKRSRARQKITHTTGSKSFARVRDELEEANGGEMIGEVDFYESTHLTKTGTFVDEEAANTLKKAKEMLAERSSTTPSSDPVNIQMEVMAEVRGTVYGRVRGLGLGPTPAQVFGLCPSSSWFARNDEVAELKAQVHELKELVATLIRQQNPNQGTPLQSRIQLSVSSHTTQRRPPGNATSGSYSGERSYMH